MVEDLEQKSAGLLRTSSRSPSFLFMSVVYQLLR